MEIDRSVLLKFNKDEDVDNWFIYHEILNTLDKYSDRVFYIDNYLVDGTVEVFQDTEIKTDQVVREKKKEYLDKEFKNSSPLHDSSVKPDSSRLIAIYVNRHQLSVFPGYYAGYYDDKSKKWIVIFASVREEFDDEQISWWTELEFTFNEKEFINNNEIIKITSGPMTASHIPVNERRVAIKRKYIPGYFMGYYNDDPEVKSWIITFSDGNQEAIDNDDIECWYELEHIRDKDSKEDK